jgi:putative endopeptidase
VSSLCAAAVLAASFQPTAVLAADTASTPATHAAALGEFGLDLSARKLSVKPGDDFFAHAGGTWYDTFVIPEDRASFGSAAVLDELSQKRVREIIEEAAASKSAPGSPEQKVGDYYASFMDESAIEAAGLKPAKRYRADPQRPLADRRCR